MISGAHVIVNSKDAEADRAFFRDVLGFKKSLARHALARKIHDFRNTKGLPMVQIR